MWLVVDTSVLAAVCRSAAEANVGILDEATYSAFEDEARGRSLRDQRDWPVVASAPTLRAAISTNDNDLLGTGVATGFTETLQAWIGRQAP